MSDLPSVWQATLQKQLSHNEDIWNFLEGDLWGHPQTLHGRGSSEGFAVIWDGASMPIKNKCPYVSKNNLVYGKYWGETFIVSLRSIPSLFAMPLLLGQAEGGPDLRSRAAPCCGQCGATSAWLVRRTPARSDLAGGRMLTQ